ncbi:DUF397 domain-containing protein [Kitasatospora aburaviensis]|uniref:DUF397 domain-containing protein n=1 Tax=Kitasatospora aburaviensis TaxID=67265 RepID=A0ABW1EX75_9ACTN
MSQQPKRTFTRAELSAATWLGTPEDPAGPQIAYMPDGYVVMRHGGDRTAPVLVYDADEWAAFKAAAAAGEFDDLPEQGLPDDHPARL